MAYLIVDGYNIVNNWPELENLRQESMEHARDKLIAILSEYQALSGKKLLVVFDAHLVKGGVRHQEQIHDLEVIFTREGETADAYIERVSGQLAGEVVVATSDWAEQRVAMGRGALRISARELRLEVMAELERGRRLVAREPGKKSLDAFLDDDQKSRLEKWRREK